MQMGTKFQDGMAVGIWAPVPRTGRLRGRAGLRALHCSLAMSRLASSWRYFEYRARRNAVSAGYPAPPVNDLGPTLGRPAQVER
jgi:hypothetical protein